MGIKERLEQCQPEFNEEEVQQFVDAYIVCALWSSVGPDGDALDEDYDSKDISPEALEIIQRDCRDFLRSKRFTLRYACTGKEVPYTLDQAGHDFWLTRNGHGAGFWDRGLDSVGEDLTKAAKVYGGLDMYPGDDGKLYF